MLLPANINDLGKDNGSSLWSVEKAGELERLLQLESQGALSPEQRQRLEILKERYYETHGYFADEEGNIHELANVTFGKNFATKVKKHIHQVRYRYGSKEDIPSPGKGGVEAVKRIIRKRILAGKGYESTYSGEPVTMYEDGKVVYVVRKNNELWTILRNTKYD